MFSYSQIENYGLFIGALVRSCDVFNSQIRHGGYKTFIEINSTEYEIYYTFVGIMTFMSRIKTPSERFKAGRMLPCNTFDLH